MLNHRIRLITIAFLAVLGLVLLAGSVASAQGPAPTTAASTATATFTPTKVVTSTVAVTSTATTVPPTATKLPPTATLVPPTATTVPPTATLVPPTATKVPPTATKVPPTATKVPPTATLAPKAPARSSARVYTGSSGGRFYYPSYNSSINLQNLSGLDANITLTFYDQSGSPVASVPDTILASSPSKVYFPIPVTAPFNGSSVISSGQNIASIVNIIGGNMAAMDSYVGSSSGSQTVYLPLLMYNNSGIFTWFNVQNASSTNTDAVVNVSYSDGTSASHTIKAGAAWTFSQQAETHSQAIFSGTVTNASTNQPLVVTVVEETPSTMSAYTGFAAGSTNPVMPLINVQPNLNIITGVTILNMGSGSTNVTVSYTPAPPPTGAGSACTETQTIPGNSNRVFALAAFANGSNSTCVPGSRFIGSAQVTANSGGSGTPLAAIVNQAVPGSSDGGYAGVDPNAATNTVVLPLIMDRNAGTIWTSLSVMNVGGGSTKVTCSFSNTGYSANTTGGRTLTAGASFTEFQNGNIAYGYVGSGTCTAASPTDKIVAIVNQLGPGPGDQLLVYNGIKQ